MHSPFCVDRRLTHTLTAITSLEDLYISESHRSKGLAKSLFVALGQIASREDLARIDWAVLDWNVGAKKVYTALGATLKSEWEGMRLDGAALKKLIE